MYFVLAIALFKTDFVLQGHIYIYETSVTVCCLA